MGLSILCDSCGADVARADRITVQATSIAEGSVQIDLCWECAQPVRALAPYETERLRLADQKAAWDQAQTDTQTESDTKLTEMRAQSDAEQAAAQEAEPPPESVATM